MQKKQFVRELRPKEDVESVFMVKHIAKMESRDGKNYLNMILTDSTGDMEARKWQGAAEVVKSVRSGDFVQIRGKVNLYQNRLQVIVQDVDKVESKSDLNENDFVRQAQEDGEKMFEQLMAIVNELDDVYIRDLLKNVLYDNEINRRIKVWSAGKSIHHAYKSGLLEHILSCSQLAVTLSAHYNANKNYVVAGAILHDLCKVYELTEGPLVEYTDEGKLVGHLVKAVELIDHFSSTVRGFPYGTKLHLKHIILSHHGQYEYGSPKIPQTSEAYLVHLIDLMDSKMNALEMIKDTDQYSGRWSGYVKHLDRVVFKDELPYYTDYRPEQEQNERPGRSQKKPEKKDRKLTHNMSEMLKDFQTDDKKDS